MIILFSSCLKENAIPISSSFSIEVAEDKTAPVIIKLQNDSYGADEYEWIFRVVRQVTNEGSAVSMRFI